MTNDDAIRILENTTIFIGRTNGKLLCADAINKAIEALKQSAQPEHKTGRWIFETLDGAPGYRPTVMFCSTCGRVSIADYNYCPNCGARMEVKA